jgi:hypothetical protein
MRETKVLTVVVVITNDDIVAIGIKLLTTSIPIRWCYIECAIVDEILRIASHVWAGW